MKKRNSGNTIIMVLIVGTALTVATFSTLDLVQSQARLNKSAVVSQQTKQAAEGLIQTGFAELHSRYQTTNSFPLDSLAPNNNPLSISDEWVNYYTGQNSVATIDVPSNRSHASVSDFGTEKTEIIGGRVSTPTWTTINALTGDNQFDSMRGSRVLIRWIEILAKVTASHPSLGERTAHARQIMEIRDAPLASYAIFYNLPMEIAPGADMNIYGPVHVNNGAWVQASDGRELVFHDRFTVAGDLQHGRHPDSGASDANGAVKVKNPSGTPVSLFEDDTWDQVSQDIFTGGWLESGDPETDPLFKDLVTTLFQGNLATSLHGIIQANPPGVSNYIEDTDPDTIGKQSFNSAYNLIQPPVNKNVIESISDAQTKTAVSSIEEQKISNLAGLIVEVSSGGSLSYSVYDRDADGKITYDVAGNPIKRSLNPSSPIATYETFTRSTVDEEGNSTIASGLYDKRQDRNLDIVNLDIGALATLVHSNDAANWGGGANDAPENWWNGAVYVEFPQEASSSSRPDGVNPAIQGQALKLSNGQTIPNPSFLHDQDLYGTTIGTNQAVYIEGHYNADGDASTGSPVEPDDPDSFATEGGEAPAAIFADAVTFLSTNWTDANSDKGQSERIAADTEVSAAIITGLVPSGEEGSNSYSGGVENFPRFLENWGGKTITIRGSMAALFESEVATERWGKSDVYSAPNRDWGFHSKFAEGFGPIGVPSTRAFRGRDYDDLSEAEYTARIAEITSFLDSI